ncbi:glycosyltransferase family 39 protein [Streptomyces sp. NPDC089919]|uniref:glycosyltransferase family 39 protein n=1 Tax=Streptomyces sp. NPDC089919 TaxID=3155188 RepID=UPI003446EFF9
MRLGRWGVPGVPAAAALAVGVWGVDRGTMWRDEGVTWQVARRSLPQIWRLVHSVDAVHALYYALMHAVLALDPRPGEVVLRLPSVAGTALTAALVAELGRRLARPRVGLWAGLAYAATPFVSRYAQEGRSYALVAALVTLATLLFVRGRWAGYAAALAAAGLLHVFALLVVPAHLVSLLLGRLPVRRWAVAAGAAVAVVAPLAVYSSAQSGQVGWLVRPSWSTAGELVLAFAGPGVVVTGVVLALCLVGLAGRAVAVVAGPLAVVPPLLLLLVSQWHPLYYDRYVLYALAGVPLLAAAGLDAVLSAARSLSPPRPFPKPVGSAPGPPYRRSAPVSSIAGRAGIAAQRHDPASPAFEARGLGRSPSSGRGGEGTGSAGTRAPGRAAGALVGVLLIGVGFWAQLGDQRAERTAGSRGDDFAAVARVARREFRAGDAVVYLPDWGRRIELTYPAGFRAADDVGLGRDGAGSGTLYGTEVVPETLRGRLAGHDRVWAVLSRPATFPDWVPATPAERAKTQLLRDGYAPAARHRAGRSVLVLYVRRR